MKEKIYTIPLNAALEQDTECLLCVIKNDIEKDALQFFTGAAMMEPDVRVVTNELGFCARHTDKMMSGENKLSVALMLQTRAREVMNMLSAQKEKKGIFGKISQRDAVVNAISEGCSSCAVCERVQRQMKDCVDNFLYLLGSQQEFRSKFLNSKGLCIGHFAECAEKADEKLFSELLTLQKKQMKRISEENDRFILKFDYRNRELAWENAKDAPIRIAGKLLGGN